MELPKENGGGNFKPIEPGTYGAICTRFIDLGTQETRYQGEVSSKRIVLLSWEIPEERVEYEHEGRQINRPALAMQRFTWSMHTKSRLRPFLESWRGMPFKESDLGPGGFDTKNLVGAPALLNIINTEKDGNLYSNIASISRLPKGMEKPEPEGDLIYIALQEDRFNQVAFDALSDKMRDTIAKSAEYQAVISGGTAQSQSSDSMDDIDDEIPF